MDRFVETDSFYLHYRWDYAEAPNDSLDWRVQMRLLVPTVQLVCSRRGDQAQILMQQDRYLRVLFTDGKSGGKSTGEFYFTPDDTTVQFRVGSLSSASVPLPPSETLNDVK